MDANGAGRVVMLAIATAGSGGAGFASASELDCPVGTRLRQDGDPTALRHEVYCAREDGAKHGPFRRFDIGERTDGSFANGREIGTWRSWYKNGRPHTLRRYVAGRLEGLAITWDLDGTIASRGRYQADRREGPWVVNDMKVTGRGNYRHDAREGRWSFSSEGHRIAAGTYSHGEFEGSWSFHWPTGALESRGTFHRGLKHGRWRYFEPEGWLRVDIQCRGGEAHGRFLALDEHGRIVMEGVFSDGVGGVTRHDGNGSGSDLCGDDCWASGHCDTKEGEYRTVEDS